MGEALMLGIMSDRGTWWKGLTLRGMEVAVSKDLYEREQRRQERLRQRHPRLIRKLDAPYGMPAYQCTQWWYDHFYGLVSPTDSLGQWQGMSRPAFPWSGRRSAWSSWFWLGRPVRDPHLPEGYYRGSGGTLVFRKLTPLQVEHRQNMYLRWAGMTDQTHIYFTRLGS